tara:strand:+ start:188 stop:727 length:540 start_codon:yes stop_codon:yes gene_type:complete
MNRAGKFIMWLQIILALVFLSLIENAKANEVDCLVEAIYFESRSEEFIGQLAVANVILERVRSPKFPDTVCTVVHDGQYYKGVPVKHRCAFSYWCDGKKEIMKDKQALTMAKRVAHMALDGIILEDVQGATYYHASYANPKWASQFELASRIGKHLFYYDTSYHIFKEENDSDAQLQMD